MEEYNCPYKPKSPEHIDWYKKQFNKEESTVTYHQKFQTKENPGCLVVIYQYNQIAHRTFKNKAIDTSFLYERKPSFEEMYANHYPNWRVTFFKYFDLDTLIEDELLNEVTIKEINKIIKKCRHILPRRKK